MLVQVVRGCPVRNGVIDFFPPAIVNSQIAKVDRLKLLERMVFGSSPLLPGVFVRASKAGVFFDLSRQLHAWLDKICARTCMHLYLRPNVPSADLFLASVFVQNNGELRRNKAVCGAERG